MKLVSIECPVCREPVEKYPGLYKSTDELIVLMMKRGEGTVVYSRTTYEVGEYVTGWNMSFFSPYEGEIKLCSYKEEDGNVA